MSTNRLPCTMVQAKQIAIAAELAGHFEEVENTKYSDQVTSPVIHVAKGNIATVTVCWEGNGWTHILDAESETPEEYDRFVENLWHQYLNQYENSHEKLIKHVETGYKGNCECLQRLQSA